MVDLLPFAADPAARWVRPRAARIEHVELAVTIDLALRRVHGSVTHRCRWIAGDHATLTFDQHGITITAATVDGKAAAFTVGLDEVNVAIPKGRETFLVGFEFVTTEPRKGIYFVPADVVPTAAHQVEMAWTQGAMEDHAHWFPCYDSPNNFSTYGIALRHRSELAAIAGGVRVSKSDEVNGWSVTTYVQDRPHVLYLLNVVVGDFVAVEDPTCTVPVTHWLPRGRESCSPAIFRATGFAITELATFIGVPYPWQRYGHAVVHRFMWGGMENTTLTTITDRALITPDQQQREDVDFDSLVIHELVHQWFGDLLTMKSWSDIWLNESFATYLEARITARWRAHQRGDREPDVVAQQLWHNRAAYLEQHGSRYQRPLVTNRWDDAYEMFDRVAYEQGSLVLHALCSWLGEDRFHAALKLYTTRHAHGLVETADFRQAVEDATGEPADWFFDQWVMRAGHPSLTMRWSHDPARGRLSVTIEQPEPCYRLQLTIGIAGAPSLRIEVTRTRETFVCPAVENPRWVMADPAGDLLITWDEQHAPASLALLVADASAPAHARARAAGLASKLYPTAELKRAVIAAAGSPVELVREEAVSALGAWLAGDELLALYPAAAHERHRRLIAAALGRCRGISQSAAIATQVLAWAESSTSGCTAGDLLAARGALEVAGATDALRPFLIRPSWNHRLAAGALRGLGASTELAAVDVVLVILADREQPEALLTTALTAAGMLGARHVAEQPRIMRALEPYIDDRRLGATMALRASAMRAGASLGTVALRAAISAQREREPFGNIRRVAREALHALDLIAATTTATALLTRRIDDLEGAKTKLESRLEAIERRLS